MPKVTLKDVAARAGVSFQTVSKVINGRAQVTPETESRIWQVVRELNYQPNVSARNLRAQASNLIGYAWHATPNSAWHPILDKFLYSIIDAAKQNEFLITIFTVMAENGHEAYIDTEPYDELYARGQVEGFVLANTIEDDPRIAYLMRRDIPFVTFGRSNSKWDFCWVDVDGQVGIEAAVAHLRERGHGRIGLISWPAGSQTGQHRERGYLSGLAQAGISFEPDWLVRGENNPQTGAAGITHYLSLPETHRPTAVVCISDQIAAGALSAAGANGLQVGRDMAITGYDDAPVAACLYPALTTVRQPIEKVGERVVELLIRQINDEPIAQKGVLLEPELVIRESS